MPQNNKNPGYNTEHGQQPSERSFPLLLYPDPWSGMCGIIGVISLHEAFADIYNGLITLQHRGQDSAGIMTSDSRKTYAKKGVGLLFDVFGNRPEPMKGSMGIGHLRYPTAGSSIKCDAQPIIVRHDGLRIGMAHNGNLENSIELRSLVKKMKRRLSTTADTELMLHMLSNALDGKPVTPENVFSAVKEIMSQAKGSYSVTCLLGSEGLLAFRDPMGIMPLAIGERDGGYCIASETVALQTLGYNPIRDVKPGSALFIGKDVRIHEAVIAEKRHAHCMFQWVYFARPDSTIEGRSVYEARLELGKALARKWKAAGNRKVDIVIPVPDTSKPAATAVAEELGVPYREGLIKNRYIGRTFIMPEQSLRDQSVRMKLNPITEQVKGRSVAVVDDSIVRGTTSGRIVSMLREAGAKEVHFFVTCPPVKWPCFYGIDMSTRKELIASEKSVEEIRKHIGADTLTYQDLDGLRKAIGLQDLCMACLDGNYPTGITKEKVAILENERNLERKAIVGVT